MATLPKIMSKEKKVKKERKKQTNKQTNKIATTHLCYFERSREISDVE